jgi:hypothetical protein
MGRLSLRATHDSLGDMTQNEAKPSEESKDSKTTVVAPTDEREPRAAEHGLRVRTNLRAGKLDGSSKDAAYF